MSNKAILKQLQTRIRKRNGELQTQAIVELLLGLVVVAVTFGLMFAALWIIGWMLFTSSSDWVNWFAAGVTGTFFLVAMISAWRKVEPTANLAPPPEKHATVEWMEEALSTATGVTAVNPRYAVARAAMLLLSGPMNIFEAIANWRHRLPADDETIHHAADLLECCRSGAAAKDIRSPRSAILLRRLLLIRFVNVGNSPRLEPTESGQRLLKKSNRA